MMLSKVVDLVVLTVSDLSHIFDCISDFLLFQRNLFLRFLLEYSRFVEIKTNLRTCLNTILQT